MDETRTTVRRPPADDLRVSDDDRERVLEELRAHAADGRLGVDELAERTDAALAAKTRADLHAVVADLPRARRRGAPRSRVPRRMSQDLREHVRAYVGVMALLVVIWALTGAGYFWPIWPMAGWGIGVLSHAGMLPMCGGGRRMRAPSGRPV